MFTRARIKLTLWYLLIIIAISTSFSFFLYRQVTSEVRRSLRLHTLRLIPGSPFGIPSDDIPNSIENQIYEELRSRIILELLLINLGIAGISTMAGYFLAGKTLQPIERMMEDQKRFVSDASHELRTPLTAMKTEIEVALREKNISSSESKELLVSNLEEVERMRKLTDYLLNLHKYQDQTLKLPMDSIDLKEIIVKAIQLTEPMTQEKEIQIIEKVKTLPLKANSMSLTELVTILLDNAIKYSKKKGEIIIRSSVRKNTAIIEIEDFGSGIKSTEIPYIFNRFYRADSSRSKTQVDGYGLGLSIAKQIVDLHHGTIEVKSELGKGSTFKIALPF